ncbi:MAG TPA: hypothetical protein VGH66_09520, partial [Acidimicrobiales bacterium]
GAEAPPEVEADVPPKLEVGGAEAPFELLQPAITSATATARTAGRTPTRCLIACHLESTHQPVLIEPSETSSVLSHKSLRDANARPVGGICWMNPIRRRDYIQLVLCFRTEVLSACSRVMGPQPACRVSGGRRVLATGTTSRLWRRHGSLSWLAGTIGNAAVVVGIVVIAAVLGFGIYAFSGISKLRGGGVGEQTARDVVFEVRRQGPEASPPTLTAIFLDASGKWLRE